MKRVSVFMDVEDPINPLADDAALELAELFTSAGVRGSFCMTGEKCRTLAARGRADVIDAFLPHCLGLHTDSHSFHPTTMELLADCGYEEGCARAFEAEAKGFESFRSVFDRSPAFWGGAGNTWSPEIADALGRLGVPAYSYALTQLPEQAVHRFNGALALPQALSVSELDWAVDERARAESDRVVRRLHEIDQPWIGVFVGHPTKLRYRDFWDLPYNAGRTPPTPELTELLPAETYERSKSNLRAFLDRLPSEFDVVGVDDTLTLPWSFRDPTGEEMRFFEANTSLNLRAALGWPIHRPGLSADRIVEKTLALAGTLQVAFLAE